MPRPGERTAPQGCWLSLQQQQQQLHQITSRSRRSIPSCLEEGACCLRPLQPQRYGQTGGESYKEGQRHLWCRYSLFAAAAAASVVSKGTGDWGFWRAGDCRKGFALVTHSFHCRNSCSGTAANRCSIRYVRDWEGWSLICFRIASSL